MGRFDISCLLILWPLLSVGPARGQTTPAKPDYLNASLPTAKRVDDLLSRMTLEEKVAQMMCLWNAKKQFTDGKGKFDPAQAPQWFKVGIGRIERPSDGHGARAQAEFTNAIQKWVRENTRLGIPVIFHDEALHGLMGPEATSFPQAIALASTWNPELVEKSFAIVAREVRARGSQQVLAPVVDIARDPRWGRFEETFGEDPYLVSQMGLAAVRGFQGGEKTIPADRVIATLKHMTGHGQPDSGTNVGPTSLGERTLRDFFFPPFEVAVKQGHARSLMPSYNEVDGIPSHTNRWMLHDVLRKEWGFDGIIVSDWQAVRQLAGRHHVAADDADAARQALNATVDVELPDVETYYTLVEQVKQKKVAESAIDDAVRRLLREKFDLGLFANPYVDPDKADEISGSADARPFALEAARQAIVLLKNEGSFLPLNPEKTRRVAVIGPHSAEVMLGCYAGVPRHMVSILEGIRQRLGKDATVSHAEGVRLTEDSVFTKGPQPLVGGTRSRPRSSADKVVPANPAENRRRIADAVALAKNSDVAVVVVGDNEQTAREAYADNHLGDRTDLRLVGQQEELIRAVLETKTPTVVVLVNGRPPAIQELADKVPAILECWYLGQEGGTALAELLFGDVNPSGKLPATFPRSVGQIPIYYNHKPTALRGYVLDSNKPLFAFGHGLSYTTFSYAAPTVNPAKIAPDGKATVSVEVTNTGPRAAEEVVQLYIRAEVSRATRPVMELRGFRRVTLKPGEKQTVTFELGPEHLSYHGPDMKRVVEPGKFQVMVGGSSAEVKAVALEVAKEPGNEPGAKPADAVKPVARIDANSKTAHEQLLEKAKKGRIDVYFAGDSITRRWGATDYPDFLANWKENFHGWNAANFGWGGDTVQNVLWRLTNGELDKVNPKVIVVMAGTNNIGTRLLADGDEAKVGEIVNGLKAVLEVCRERSPDAVVIFMGITPRNDSPKARAVINKVNEALQRMADGKTVRYLNINEKLADKEGRYLDGMSPDRLHLTVKGYQAWAGALKPVLKELLGPPAKEDLAPSPTGDPSAAGKTPARPKR
jgi:beta-glucosidase